MTTEELAKALSDAYQAVRRAQNLSSNPASLQDAERGILQAVSDFDLRAQFTTFNSHHTELPEDVTTLSITNGK